MHRASDFVWGIWCNCTNKREAAWWRTRDWEVHAWRWLVLSCQFCLLVAFLGVDRERVVEKVDNYLRHVGTGLKCHIHGWYVTFVLNCNTLGQLQILFRSNCFSSIRTVEPFHPANPVPLTSSLSTWSNRLPNWQATEPIANLTSTSSACSRLSINRVIGHTLQFMWKATLFLCGHGCFLVLLHPGMLLATRQLFYISIELQ